jgi:hypothetical protein
MWPWSLRAGVTKWSFPNATSGKMAWDDDRGHDEMNRPRAAQIERAKRLLAAEGDSGASAAACAAAAGRVYDKLAAQLAPLLGLAGVEALFVRSAKLARADLVPAIEGATQRAAGLRAFLGQLEASAAGEAAAALFATFLDLVITFIGDRLTVQVLRGAWPVIDTTAPRENHE